MKQVALVVAALSLAACGKKEEVDACDAAGAQFAKVWQETAKDKGPGAFKRVRNQIGGTCRGGMWGEASTKCLRAMKTMDDARTCAATFPGDDREDLEHVLAELYPPPGDDCKRVADHEVQMGKEAMAALVGEERGAALRALGESVVVLESACRSTTWSKEAVSCMNARSVIEDTKDCAQYFTPEQLAALPKAYGGSGSAPADEEEKPDCNGAVDHLAVLQRDELMAIPSSERKPYEERNKKMRDLMLKACTETEWSAELTSCMKNMKSLADGKECEELESPEQKAAADKARDAGKANAGSVQ